MSFSIARIIPAAATLVVVALTVCVPAPAAHALDLYLTSGSSTMNNAAYRIGNLNVGLDK